MSSKQYESLRDFIAALEADGRLVRVAHPVSTVLEMTEIQTRLLAEDGPAVLFENPVDGDGAPQAMPVLVNLFGTVDRVAAGMGRKPGDLRALGALADDPTVGTLTVWLHRIFPDLESFNWTIEAVHGLPIPAADVAWATVMGLGWCVAFLTAAALVFERRDFR